MDLSRKMESFNTTIIHSRKHYQKPQKPGFCKSGHLGMTIPQNQSHAFSQKSLDMILEKRRQQSCTPNSPKFVFIFQKRNYIYKKKST